MQSKIEVISLPTSAYSVSLIRFKVAPEPASHRRAHPKWLYPISHREIDNSKSNVLQRLLALDTKLAHLPALHKPSRSHNVKRPFSRPCSVSQSTHNVFTQSCIIQLIMFSLSKKLCSCHYQVCFFPAETALSKLEKLIRLINIAWKGT